jgi:hypothetical protein
MKLRLLVSASIVTINVFAQSYYGGLGGTVLDQNGGALSGAKVTLINEGTNAQRSAVSASAGEFVFTELVPGTYGLTVEVPGFKKFEQKGVLVGTQQQVAVDAKMQVGQVSESIEVSGAVEMVETSNASQGQVIDNQKLTELPNLGRNPFMLSKLAQNVVPVGNPAYNRMEDQSGSSQISIAGGPVRGNNYLVDGIPITDSDNRAIIIPSLEAVEEVKIQANTYDAEMARTGGGMFNTLMKSGANQYHGSVYGHLRKTAWDANSFFNNAGGVPITDQPNDTWGASFGGAVKIPHVYDGKNKTFFYLGYEHYDDIQSSSSVFATPTAAEKTGDFSQSLTPAGTLNTIYDPLDVVNGARQAFPGNIIPTARLNPTGLAIASFFQPDTSSPAYYGANDLNAPGRLPCRAAQYTGKIDEDFFPWWRASVSYLRYFSLEPGNTEFTNNISTPDQWRLQRRVDATQLNSLFTLNPTTTLAIRYGFNRFPNYSYDMSQGYDLNQLKFSPALISQIPKSLSQFPDIGMTDLYSLGVADNNSFFVLASNNFSVEASKYKGRHSLKAGFDYRKIKAAGNDANDAAGNYDFNGIFTKSSPTSAGSGGADLADMLLGYPSSAAIYTSSKLTDIANYYGLYLQDDFRVSSRLTVNAGLRWEHEPGLYEVNNGMLVNFNGSTANPLAANVSGITPMGEVQYANAGRRSVGDPTPNKMGPRFGFAYKLDSKTVVRGGYGIFWAPQFALGSPIATVGYNQTTSPNASVDNNQTPALNLTNAFTSGILQPVGNTLGNLTGIGQSFSLVDPTAKSPYVEQYSLDVQRELPGGIATEVGLVGSKSNHLTTGTANINLNALNPSLLSEGTALTKSVANPFYGNGGLGVIGTANVQASQLLLPYPTYSAINELFDDNNKAKYYSLVVKAQKRLSHGVSLLSTFTWSRNWDESGGGPGNTLNSGSKGPQNPYDMAAEYAFSDIDTPMRWSTAVTYDLPIGKGKALANRGGPLNYIIGGWVANAVTIYQTGFPLQISQATNFNSAFGYASQRPNATGASPVTSGSLEQRLNDYINPAAFSTAPEFTFGNVGRTIDMRGPGQANWDLSMFKNITIKEVFKAQFRCEALNAFNTPLFYGPGVAFGSSSFGKITSQANFSRQMQLALRFSF